MTDCEYISQRFDFRREEIDDLAERLGKIESLLSKRERALLLAIFSAAKDHVSVPGHVPTQEHASLKDQLLRAFVPNDCTAEPKALIADKEYIVMYRIGSDPLNPPP